jgi:hypothetical protein
MDSETLAVAVIASHALALDINSSIVLENAIVLFGWLYCAWLY